jgi:hypothetical protein
MTSSPALSLRGEGSKPAFDDCELLKEAHEAAGRISLLRDDSRGKWQEHEYE